MHRTDSCREQRHLRLAALALIAGAALLRVPALFGDFWLDEIWSVLAVAQLQSPLEIFTRYLSDNNHHLNSLYVYLLGADRPWPIYRLLALAAGIGSVVFAWRIGKRRSPLDAILHVAIIGTAYLLIHYSSEARGYSLAIFFSLATFYIAQQLASTIGLRSTLLLWLCSALGLLSHASYGHVLVGLCVWLPAAIARGSTWRQDLRRCAGVLSVPVALALLYYMTFIRRMQIGGGNDYQVADVIVETLSYTGGGPPFGIAAKVIGGLVLLVLVIAIAWRCYKREPVGLWFAVTAVGSPALAVALMSPPTLHPRYFLVNVVFGLLAIAMLLGDLLHRPGRGRALGLTCLMLYFCGNLYNTSQLWTVGRGQYLEAVEHLANATPQPTITVSSDHDFRNRTMLDYYRRFLPPGRQLRYYDRQTYPEAGPRWLLTHHKGPRALEAPQKELLDSNGNQYQLERVLAHRGPSGWTWRLYRKNQDR